jgi:hypothetical protein
MTPDPTRVEASVLAQPHRAKLRAAPPSERPKIRREILRDLRSDMAKVRESVGANLFRNHKALYDAFRDAIDETTSDSEAVRAHAS